MRIACLSGSRAAVLGAALVCVSLTSCGNGYSRATGQIVQNGTAVQIPTGERVVFDIESVEGVYPAVAVMKYAKSDGSFVLDMNDGTESGLPPGKYKISVNEEQTELKGVKVNSKLFRGGGTFDLPQGGAVHVIVDIAAGTVTPS
jgi:hypothetical protein